MSIDTVADHERLIEAMMDPRAWSAGGARRERIDTHISTVVLAGELAFKIKKPLDLGFLDFVSLDSRKRACAEEIRLNRRLAPEIYLGVSRVTGSVAHPEIDGAGETIDWAVRMRRFDARAILSRQVEKIDASLIDDLAEQVAAFHLVIAKAPAGMSGGAQAACAPMRQNFEQIAQFVPTRADAMGPLSAWTEEACERLAAVMNRRHEDGFTREGHGDLHLGNVALIDGSPVVFDAIEFNPAFRWIDVINDIAFLVMDLTRRGLEPLAQRFLNRYLESTGDFDGLRLLALYCVYRALVRAKIAAIRVSQLDRAAAERVSVERELDGYLQLAGELAQRSANRGGIVLMHGVSGSGKSVVAQALADSLYAVTVRSDVERKRLLGLQPADDAAAHDGYRREVTESTYRRLLDVAAMIAGAGYVAIVDATFLSRARRDCFGQLARKRRLPFAIVACDAAKEVLVERIRARSTRADNVSDADLDVLSSQLADREPVAADEADRVWTVSPTQDLDVVAIRQFFAKREKEQTRLPRG
jgi:hypothetical protein